jgi:predicted phage terminase large subunit-like protein
MDRFELAQLKKKEYESMDKTELRTKLISSFRFFVEWVHIQAYETEFIFEEVHEIIIDTLQKYAEGKLNKRNLAICVCPSAGKSVLIRYFIDWCFTRNPSVKFLYISGTDKVMKELSTEARNVLLLPAWQELFGVEIDNSKLTGAESSKTNWVLKSGGISSGLTAATSFGNVLGISAGNPNTRGFQGGLILDDFQTLDTITQEYQRNKEIERFKFLQKRRRGTSIGTIVVMQRLCIGDLVDYIKENEKDRETDGWEIIEVPELYEENGEYKARCPHVRGVKELLEIKEKDPFTFYSQHQQAPIQLGGRWFKEEWFRTYTTPPLHPRIVFISTDFAFKKGEERDWSVFGLWAIGEDNNLYLIDWRRFKDDSIGVKSKLIDFFQKSREKYPHITKICVEKSIANTAFIPDIARNNPAMNFVETSKTGMNSKVLYIQTAREFFEAGRVLFPEENKPTDIINEHLLWTPDGTSAHDDCCDMVAQAIHEGLGKLVINSINI